MKQSELHRDIFEPGWREKEQAHYAKLIDAVPTVKQSLQVPMTTQTAESLALELTEEVEDFPHPTRLESEAAAMLRSQAQELEEAGQVVANFEVAIKKADAEIERLKKLLQMLVSYTEACEGLLNCKPAGQVTAARAALEQPK